MAQSSLNADFVTALGNYNEPGADPHAQIWFKNHTRIYTNEDAPTPPDYPPFYKSYFLNNLIPEKDPSTEAGINAIKTEPILVDVASGPLRIKGTYTINGDKLEAEVGLQAAPQTYVKLGELKGNPSKGPVTAKFDKNPDFYSGSVSVRVRTPEELAATGIKTLGLFDGILGSINWKGLGIVVAKRAIEVLAAI